MKIKLIYILILITVATMNIFAQESAVSASKADTTVVPNYWDIKGNASFMMNQASFSNWASSGETSITGAAYFSLIANYKKNGHEWNNNLNLGYGLMKSEEYSYYKKTEDKIDFQSKYGWKILEKLNVSGVLNYKSQLSDGYAYPNDSVAVSSFMAPAYLNLSIGMDYKPVKGLSIFATPISGRTIFVLDDNLADLGKYIPSPAIYDSLGNKIKDGEKVRFEFGANLIVQYNQEIMKNVIISSKLLLFCNYTDQVTKNRANVDVDWDTKIDFKINNYITANISCRLVYDHDVLVPLYDKVDGVKVPKGTGRRLQIKELFGLGFSYRFNNK